jgi:Flp pilus assembly protein TadG
MRGDLHSRNGRRGQGLVEFALVAPVFLLLLLGILDFGRVGFYFVQGSSLARTAARWASVYDTSGAGLTDAQILSNILGQANSATIPISQPGGCGTATPPKPPVALSACQQPPLGQAYLFIDRSNAGFGATTPYILVSVVYAFRPTTPMLSDLTGTIYVVATSAMDTEWTP